MTFKIADKVSTYVRSRVAQKDLKFPKRTLGTWIRLVLEGFCQILSFIISTETLTSFRSVLRLRGHSESEPNGPTQDQTQYGSSVTCLGGFHP